MNLRINAPAAVLTVLLAGCGPAGAPSDPPAASPAPSPSGPPVVCPQLIIAPPQMVTPAAGATGVDPAIGTITVSGAATGETLRLTANGTTIAAGPFMRSANGILETAAVPPLAGRTTYTVVIDGIPGFCGSNATSATIGTFTTR